MTAESVAIEPTGTRTARPRPFLGFSTIFRKEVAEWIRGRRALIVAAVVVPITLLPTLSPFLMPEDAAASGLAASMDPTVNVLIGWSGPGFAMIAMLAAMTLMTAERDRGTLAWTLTNPVSPTSVIAAKWSAAVVVYGTVAVALPLLVSSIAATVAYGAAPDLGTVITFGVLYLTVPAFWIGLMVALGTGIKATAGVAGVGFLVMFLPIWLGALAPVLGEATPAAMGQWVTATVAGAPASTLTLGSWVVAMVVTAVAAKLVFDRQEF